MKHPAIADVWRRHAREVLESARVLKRADDNYLLAVHEQYGPGAVVDWETGEIEVPERGEDVQA